MLKLSHFPLSTLLALTLTLAIIPKSWAGKAGGASDGVLARPLHSTSMGIAWGPVTGVEN